MATGPSWCDSPAQVNSVHIDLSGGNIPTQFLGNNPARFYLAAYAIGTLNGTVSILGNDPAGGLRVIGGVSEQEQKQWTYTDIGDVIKGEIWAEDNGSPQCVVITEGYFV